MAEQVAAGAWVQIHQVVLPPGQRAAGVPADTAGVPYEYWLKGFLVAPASLGAAATIETVAGRRVTGMLVAVGPGHNHSFGAPHPALLAVGPSLRRLLAEGEQR